jgi:predicted Rossmann-fold nucleotide-binding protein
MLIQSQERLKAAQQSTRDLTDAVFVDLDLRAHSAWLHHAALRGAFFLGCQLNAEDAAHLVRHGGLVFPVLPDLPYKAFRSALYTAEELLEGYESGHHHTFASQSRDGAIYRHYKAERRTDIVGALAHRLHDHSIDVALAAHLAQDHRLRRTVGIMGGHSMRRDDPRFATIAELGWKLQKSGHFVATGGGPGAMEAGNLGAWLADRPHAELIEAIKTLAPAPTYRDEGWFDTALAVKARHPAGCDSLGVPTWFYGHEPSNLFASAIAKYFANSVREDGLISLCQGGLVFAPGSAGTIQEIFQDACQNHYGSLGIISPMVFLDRDYWTREKPVYTLLKDLAKGRKYDHLLTVVDAVDECIDFLDAHPAVEA